MTKRFDRPAQCLTTEIDGAPTSDRPGWRYEITPLTFGRGRIIHTDGMGVDDFW